MNPHRRTRKAAVAALAATAAVLSTASGASAATYCVQQPSCTGTVQPDVQAALTAAAVSPVPDRIEVGPGSFFAANGFIYVGGGAGNTVDLVGAGTDKTGLEGGSAVNNRPALILQGSAPATVSHLTVTAQAPANNLFFTAGLRIFGAADHVAVTGSGHANGVELLHGSSLSDSDVVVAGNVHGVLSADGEASVRNTSIEAQAGGTAVDAIGSGKLNVSHSKLNGDVGVNAEQGGSVTIGDSLVLASDVGLLAYDSDGKSATLDATNVTVFGTDPSVTGGRSYSIASGGSTHLNLTSSVVAHASTSLAHLASPTGSAAIVARFSAYDHGAIDQTGNGSFDQTTANLDTTDPGFVDASNRDFRLGADSPLRDAGDPAPAGGLAATDLAGNPRSTDGNGDGTAAPDIGAFELQPAPPPPPPIVEPPVVQPPVTTSDLGPQIIAANLTHRRFAVRKRATVFRIKLSKDARVRITIGRAGTLKRPLRKGANRIAFSGRIARKALKPGRYVAKITATDATGKRSKTRTLRFTVLKG